MKRAYFSIALLVTFFASVATFGIWTVVWQKDQDLKQIKAAEKRQPSLALDQGEKEEVLSVNSRPLTDKDSKLTVKLVAVGDVMLARKVGRLMDKFGLTYPLQEIKSHLAEGDITFANLESPISDEGKQLPGKGIWFRAKPETVQVLAEAGFDVLSLANNHAVDYDSPALVETLNILNQAGIKPVGAGEEIKRARQPEIIEVNGAKVAVLAYTEMADMIWSSKYPRRLKATDKQPGVAPLIKEEILKDIASVKDQVDYIAVSLHWGTEYRDTPLEIQKELAHQLIDAGVDLILGHHPHCLQGIEVYKERLIAYSLGNFVFDQNFSDKTRQGLLLKVVLEEGKIKGAKVLPIFIPESQPIVADGKQGDYILKKTQRLSRDLNTSVEIVDGALVVK